MFHLKNANFLALDDFPDAAARFYFSHFRCLLAMERSYSLAAVQRSFISFSGPDYINSGSLTRVTGEVVREIGVDDEKNEWKLWRARGMRSRGRCVIIRLIGSSTSDYLQNFLLGCQDGETILLRHGDKAQGRQDKDSIFLARVVGRRDMTRQEVMVRVERHAASAVADGKHVLAPPGTRFTLSRADSGVTYERQVAAVTNFALKDKSSSFVEHYLQPTVLGGNGGEASRLTFTDTIRDLLFDRREDLKQQTGMKLGDAQAEALKSALAKDVTLIQGPPGTGKTRVSCKILQAWLSGLKAEQQQAASQLAAYHKSSAGFNPKCGAFKGGGSGTSSGAAAASSQMVSAFARRGMPDANAVVSRSAPQTQSAPSSSSPNSPTRRAQQKEQQHLENRVEKLQRTKILAVADGNIAADNLYDGLRKLGIANVARLGVN
ncbi:unnamed protein product, partial [Amoebophrya sp. A25]